MRTSAIGASVSPVRSALNPSPSCRYSGTRKNPPTIPNRSAVVAALPAENATFLKRLSSSIGSGARDSHHKNPARSTAEPTNSHRTAPLQSTAGPSMTA